MTTLLLQQLLLYMLLLALLLPTATYEQFNESESGSHLYKKRTHNNSNAAKHIEKVVEQRNNSKNALSRNLTNYRQLSEQNVRKRPKWASQINGAHEQHVATESATLWQQKTSKEIEAVSYANHTTQKLRRNKRTPTAKLNGPQAQLQVTSSSANELHNLDAHLNLPVVPIPAPPPPPFSSVQFDISAFGVAAKQQTKSTNPLGAASALQPPCGGLLKQRYGIIQTPNFPRKFHVPIECVWIIDASDLAATTSAAFASSATASSSSASNVSIVVYLTQLYVLGGLKFTEYMYYSDDYKVPAHRVFQLTEDDVTQVASVQFNSQYLEVRFSMSSLDGTHFRALDRLLDVYGFNITYEVHHEVKPYQCNTLQCRFLGHCFARQDFSSYYCACYPGFSGTDCGRGPLCEDPHTNVCQNGGTCKHIGDAAITCHCPNGYKGTKCEIPEISEITMGCTLNTTSSDCHQECNFDHPYGNVFNSARVGRTLARSGKTRYEVTIRLGANLTAFYRATDSTDRRPGDHLPSLLERHLSRVLRNFNITKISDLELLSNSTDRLDITFHFFGIKGDSLRIREAITRMVERGRIGNITLVSNFHLFDENPPLNLMDMTVNQNSAIREDSEFIISCTAQGSSKMLFQWFKDGALVNASKATREIWTTVLPPETKDIYTAILGVTKASRMDEGIYTCKVIDWGIEQCRSLHIHIKSPPRLRVDPASVTLHRGESLRVRCLSPGNDDIKRYAQLGYSWTRNGQLFQSDPATVMWEDLYPDGSILKINNIQKSAEYACIVSNTVRPVSKSVYITVIDRNAVQLCHAESAYAVRWPTSAPGAAIISDCPKGFEGYSKRICEKRDVGNSSWLQPDFSLCIADQLLDIYNKFRALKSGFQKSNSSAILKSCFQYTINRHKRFLPGEAGFLIDMLHEVDSYLQLKGTQLEREMAAEIILHILDKVMQNVQSLNSQQQIKKLQLLTQSAALNRETIAASQLATSTSTASASAAAAAAAAASSSSVSAAVATSASAAVNILIASAADTSTALTSSSSSTSTAAIGGSKHQSAATTVDNSNGSGGAAASGGVLTVDEDSLSLDRLNSLRIYMTSVKTLPFNLRIYGDDLFSDQLYMDIGLTTHLHNIMANTTIFASVISYKNLKSFLPKTYYTRGSDTKDTDYVLASRIIQTWLFQSNRSNDNFREPLDLPFEAGHVEIIFQHESAPKYSDWLPVCGHDYKASFESTWRSDLCITKNLMENITRCICPLSGTYVVMLTKRNFNSTLTRPAQRPIFVIISCGCCLLQSCTAFAILLPIWYNRKCAITFLKMQFCVSTSSVMVIFLLGFLKMLPVNMQAIISSSLASLLLFGISTLIAIALVIHSELVPKKFCHMTTNATTAALVNNKQQQQQQQHQQQITDLEKRRSSNSAHLNVNNAVTNTTNHPPSGIRGAIGISWLMPLLFAISSPLICSIIGKWPQNWWLEVMTAATTSTSASSTIYNEEATILTKDLFSTSLRTAVGMGASDSFFNGYNLLESSNNGTTAALTNVTTTTATATTNSTVITLQTSATIPLFPPPAATSLASSTFDQHAGSMLSTAFASAYSATAITSPHDATASATPSLSFIIFIIIDILFILLFVALLLTLIKKLLWLLRKNQNPHPHPLGKYNMAIGRRLGLLYRSAILLLIKLTTDALFIVYVNSMQDSWWSYPFGLSSILLGFTILCCFVIKAESNLRSPASGGCTTTGTLKTKLSSSKTSLDENYCTGTINSPLSFYTSHEKEKDNECGIQTPLTSILTHQSTAHALPHSSVQLPLTVISTAPRCQMLAAGIQDQGIGGGISGMGSSKVETFLGGSLDRKSCLQQQQRQHQHYQQQQIKEHDRGVAGLLSTVTTTVSSPAARCCNILGGGGSGGSSSSNSSNSGTVCSNSVANSINMKRCLGGDGILSDNSSWQTHVGGGGGGGVVGPMSGIVFYDAYAAGMTGSLGRRQQQQQHMYQQQQLHVEGQHEFVGVETLDILQGVAPDSIIGIRTSSMLTTHHLQQQQQQQQYHQQQQQLPQHHKPFVELQSTVLPPTIVSIGNPTTVNTAINYISNTNSNGSGNAIITNSVTTQTPKAQKRVKIVEPTTHTFDPMMPTMTAAIATHHPVTPTPIITITSSSIDETTTATTSAAVSDPTAAAVDNKTNTTTPDDENSITGMFDRITHDLDYLLNRTNDIPPTSRLTAGNEHNVVVENDEVPPPPLPPSGSIPKEASSTTTTTLVTGSCSSLSTSSSNRGNIQHDVIVEESEVE